MSNQRMKKGKVIYYIDALVILLSFAGVRGNALLFKLLGVESQRLVTDLVLFVDFIYILLNNKTPITVPNKIGNKNLKFSLICLKNPKILSSNFS